MAPTGADDSDPDAVSEVLARSFGSSTIRITGPDGYIELRPLSELDLDLEDPE
ncbi:MAG: hypothetical protein ABEH40_03285 [Haloferacaceae archaeon]